MKLNEFFEKYKMDKTKFAGNVDVHFVTLAGYLAGRWKPSQKAAERIEKHTDGLVTVFELRGKDDRKKRNNYDEASKPDVRPSDSTGSL